MTQHRLGIITFLSEYPRLWVKLKEMGWEVIQSPGGYSKLFHPKMREL